MSFTLDEMTLRSTKFDSSTEQILRNGGWFPTRNVDVSRWLEILAPQGFNPHALAIQLLSTLGGLEIRASRGDRILFDPMIASGEFDRVEQWQRDCGGVLFPLGEALSHYIFQIDKDGRVYVAFDEGLFFLGETFGEGLHRLYFENGGTPQPCSRKSKSN